MKYILTNKENMRKIIEANSSLEARMKYQYLLDTNKFLDNECKVDEDVKIIGTLEENEILPNCWDINNDSEDINSDPILDYFKSIGVDVDILKETASRKHISMEEVVTSIIDNVANSIRSTKSDNKEKINYQERPCIIINKLKVPSTITNAFYICGLKNEDYSSPIPFKERTMSIVNAKCKKDAVLDYYNENCVYMECAGVHGVNAYLDKRNPFPIRFLCIKNKDNSFRNQVAFSASISKDIAIELFLNYLIDNKISYLEDDIVVSGIVPYIFFKKK